MPFEQVTPVVVTSARDFEVFSYAPLDVTTSAFSLSVSHVVLDVATSVFLSRHQVFKFCSFLGCLCCDPCRDLHQAPFDLSDVATSELDCVSFKSASMSQLSLTAFLSTYCCIFLLSFSFPANDELVSFFIILYINWSFLDENKTEKWTKKR